jgi:hypothetical protein
VTKGAGGFAINPSLQFRPVVARHSPAFELLRNVLSEWAYTKRSSVIQDTHRALFALFEARLASPTDTLEDGETFLHVCTTNGLQRIATNGCNARVLLIGKIGAGRGITICGKIGDAY